MNENDKPEYIFEFKYHNLHLRRYIKIIRNINISSIIIYSLSFIGCLLTIISCIIENNILYILGLSFFGIELIVFIYFIVLLINKRKYE